MAPSHQRQSKPIVAGSTRVLRPRTPTTGGVGKSDVVVNRKVVDKSAVVVSRKVVDDEGAGSGAKNVIAINKKEEMGAASVSTRILRSQSAKGRGTDAGKKYAEENANVQAKILSCSLATPKEYPTRRRGTRSVTKGQAAVVSTATRKNPRRKCVAASKTK